MDQDAVNHAIDHATTMVRAISDPQMKAAAFGALFSRLLDSSTALPKTRRRQPSSPRAQGVGSTTAPSRILALKHEGFFADQRSLSEVRDELGARGWHYALTALSGVMQALVRSRELRRVHAKLGKRLVWKYSNY